MISRFLFYVLALLLAIPSAFIVALLQASDWQEFKSYAIANLRDLLRMARKDWR